VRQQNHAKIDGKILQMSTQLNAALLLMILARNVFFTCATAEAGTNSCE